MAFYVNFVNRPKTADHIPSGRGVTHVGVSRDAVCAVWGNAWICLVGTDGILGTLPGRMRIVDIQS